MSVAGVAAASERAQGWRWLLGPSARIVDERDGKGARRLAVFLLAHLPAALGGVVACAAVGGQADRLLGRPLGWVLASGTLLVLVSYALLRLGRYSAAIATYLVATVSFPLVAPFVGQSLGETILLTTALLPAVFVTTLLAPRWRIGFSIAVVSGAAVELTWVTWPRSEVVLGLAILLVLMSSSILMGVMRRRQSQLESLHTDQLRQSHERLNALLAASRDLVVVLDARGARQSVFGGVTEITGYDPEQRGPLDYLDAMHPEDRPRIERELADLVGRPGGVLRTEWRHLHKDGCYRWYEGLATNLLAKQGVEGIVVNIRDVTDRKTAEEALARNEERYRTLFETVTDGIFLLTRDGQIVAVNHGACRMLGYTREELCRLRLADIAPPDKREHVEEINRLVAERKHLTFTAWHRRKDGTVYPVEVTVSLTQLDGQPVFMGVARDITERVRADEERRQLQEQVQHAVKMESVGRLAGGVAHDFNNLLTAILGNTHLALGLLRDGGDASEAISEIRNAALSAAGVTRQLLAFARQQPVEAQPVDVNDLIRHMLKMLERLIGENVRLRMDLSPGPLTVRADPGRLEQAIVNLVVNARDAMPPGGVVAIETAAVVLERPRAEARPLCPAGHYVVIAVADAGVGMSDEVKRHIFEPFFTTKPRGEGTGLGLATTYAAVEQSGGGIEVASEPGQGSVFTIYLPAVAALAPAAIETAEERLPELPRGEETILVVEDDPQVRNLVARALRTCGYELLVAENGEEALTLGVSCKKRIHLLLTDVVMPGMNGRELARLLLKIHPETRTLFTSGYSESLFADGGAPAAGADFLGKPYTVDELAHRVREVLDR